MERIIPVEGGPDQLCESDALALSAKPLQGKRPSLRKWAIVMHGPPGSGKTTLAKSLYDALPREERDSTVFVAYDEHGALYDIPAYRSGLASARSLPDRTALWARFRRDSQFIRSHTLEAAIRGGHALVIDTTSSGDATLGLYATLRGQGYRVVFVGCYAPLGVAASRFLSRERPGDPAEIVSKRIGALRTLLTLPDAADEARLFYNPQGSPAAAEVFNRRAGASTIPDAAALAAMARALRREGADTRVGIAAHVIAVTPQDRRLLHGLGLAASARLNAWAAGARPL